MPNLKENSHDWYVYRHIREDKNEPFYIGIGRTKDYKRAYQEGKDYRGKFWLMVANKTLWYVEILFDGLTRLEAAEKEIEFIKLYGRRDLGLGSLVNLTNGGDGIWNVVRSEETRQKIRESKIGEKNHQFGKKRSLESIRKNLETRRRNGTVFSKEILDKKSLSTIKSGQAKAVNVYKYENMEFIGSWYALSQACRELGILYMNSKAVAVANGERKQTKGYVFRYVDKPLTQGQLNLF